MRPKCRLFKVHSLKAEGIAQLRSRPKPSEGPSVQPRVTPDDASDLAQLPRYLTKSVCQSISPRGLKESTAPRYVLCWRWNRAERLEGISDGSLLAAGALVFMDESRPFWIWWAVALLCVAEGYSKAAI